MVDIFEGRYEKWFDGDIQLNVATNYKLQIFWLGYFFKIAIVFASQKFGRTGVKSDFGLKTNLNKFGTLSANLLFKMFGTKLFSILTYGTEIWFSHEALGIEKINHNFCKYTFKPPPPPPLPSQYFNTDRFKAVLMLWFLIVTCSCCPYFYFGSPIM